MSPPRPPQRDSQVRLHVVSGKGGTGKTTVAAALAIALARESKEVLLAEVEGRGGLAAVLGTPRAPAGEEPVVHEEDGGRVRLLEVDPHDALLEYLRTKVPVGPAASVLTRIGAVDFATTIAPGVRELVVLGKVYEAWSRERRGRTRAPRYDAVVLDAPPTGRAGRFLGAPAELAGLAQVGTIRRQADSITRMLQGPGTRVHLVTLLEEMPVQETAEAVADLGGRSLRLGTVVVNRDEPTLLAPGDLGADPARELADGLAAAGLDVDKATTRALLAEAREHLVTASARRVLRDRVDGLGLPVVPLRLLPGGVDRGALATLASELGAL